MRDKIWSWAPPLRFDKVERSLLQKLKLSKRPIVGDFTIKCVLGENVKLYNIWFRQRSQLQITKTSREETEKIHIQNTVHLVHAFVQVNSRLPLHPHIHQNVDQTLTQLSLISVLALLFGQHRLGPNRYAFLGTKTDLQEGEAAYNRL